MSLKKIKKCLLERYPFIGKLIKKETFFKYAEQLNWKKIIKKTKISENLIKELIPIFKKRYKNDKDFWYELYKNQELSENFLREYLDLFDDGYIGSKKELSIDFIKEHGNRNFNWKNFYFFYLKDLKSDEFVGILKKIEESLSRTNLIISYIENHSLDKTIFKFILSDQSLFFLLKELYPDKICSFLKENIDEPEIKKALKKNFYLSLWAENKGILKNNYENLTVNIK